MAFDAIGVFHCRYITRGELSQIAPEMGYRREFLRWKVHWAVCHDYHHNVGLPKCYGSVSFNRLLKAIPLT